jgi:hypothetical protein
MPYLVHPDGTIVVDTLSEAVALAEAMAVHRAAGARPAPPASLAPPPALQPLAPFGPSLWPQFLAHVDRSGNPAMRNLLAALQSVGSGRITKADLDAALGIGRTTLSGLLSGLAKNAKKVGLRADDLYVSVPRSHGNPHALHYRAGKVLLAAPPIDPSAPRRA